MNGHHYDRCPLLPLFTSSSNDGYIHLRKSYVYVFLGLMIVIVVISMCTSVFSKNNAYALPPHAYAVYHDLDGSRKPLKLNVNDTLSFKLQQKQQCMYPLVALITPDLHHCQGTLVLYGSIVRSVIAEKLPEKSICANFIYIDESMSLTAMKRWEKKQNPYANTTECSALVNEKLNDIIPIHWYAIPKLIPPTWSTQLLKSWSIAMNKIHIWAFDLYERIFILDVDIVVLRELTKLMDEIPMIYDIAGGIDGWFGCDDRFSFNGGALLMKGSAYLHSAALQMLQDKQASCVSHRWEKSEQELLNCMCGFLGDRPRRPEFKCHLLPIYDHIYPHNYHCLDAKTRPLRMIHFAANFKPWYTPANKTTDTDKLFWWCIKEAMSPSVSTNATIKRASTTNALMECKPFSL